MGSIGSACDGGGTWVPPGVVDTRENVWQFFIDWVRKQLKVVLCFSPVGSTLRVRARKFPAIVNCTSINWFHDWPQEALMSVSQKFLGAQESLPSEVRQPVPHAMVPFRSLSQC